MTTCAASIGKFYLVIGTTVFLILALLLPACGGGDGAAPAPLPFETTSGRFVAFASDATNLVAGDSNGVFDVFVHDRSTGDTTRVSVNSAGIEGDSGSYNPVVSADGRFVAFDSSATSLVAGDSNGVDDVFVHDRSTGDTTRVSVDSAGNEGNGFSVEPALSADGRFVAFRSSATNLVAGDSNGVFDVFVHDRSTGETTRVSVSGAGIEGDSGSYNPVVSADGRFVAFDSSATSLVAGDSNGVDDVFVHDRSTGDTTRVSVDSAGNEGNGRSRFATLSADGRFVAFDSPATNLVADDLNGVNDVFVHDRSTGETTRVSVSNAGNQGNDGSYAPSLSADGHLVAFDSAATNLVAGDSNGVFDVFVHDRSTGETSRVSVGSAGSGGDGGSSFAALSADGRVVGFESSAANLVVGDVGDFDDVFVHDRTTGITTRISISGTGMGGNEHSVGAALSAE